MAMSDDRPKDAGASGSSVRDGVPMYSRSLEKHALGKLRDHWTAHMNQYDTVSHRQLDSGLPYLIDSQATESSLPSVIQPLASTDSHDASLFGRTITPVDASLNCNKATAFRGVDGAGYGTNSAWYSDQIRKLRAAVGRQESIKDEHNEEVRGVGSGDRHAEERTRPVDSGDSSLCAGDIGAVPPPDWDTVSRYVPERLLPLFQQNDTRFQPHLDLLREHRRLLLQEYQANRDELPAPEMGHKRKAPNAALTEAEKRANHTASEQKRRANIRKSYEMMCELMPSIHENDGRLATELSEGRISTRSELVILEHGACHCLPAVDDVECRLLMHQVLLQRKADLQRKLLARYTQAS